jgi:hypothetical protein
MKKICSKTVVNHKNEPAPSYLIKDPPDPPLESKFTVKETGTLLYVNHCPTVALQKPNKDDKDEIFYTSLRISFSQMIRKF